MSSFPQISEHCSAIHCEPATGDSTCSTSKRVTDTSHAIDWNQWVLPPLAGTSLAFTFGEQNAMVPWIFCEAKECIND